MTQEESRFAAQLLKLGFVKRKKRGKKPKAEDQVLGKKKDIKITFNPLPFTLAPPPCFVIIQGEPPSTVAFDETGQGWICPDQEVNLSHLGFAEGLQWLTVH